MRATVLPLSRQLPLEQYVSSPMAKSYSDTYLRSGFIAYDYDGTRPFCLLCKKTILADFHAAFKDARALWDVYKNLYEILIFAVKNRAHFVDVIDSQA